MVENGIGIHTLPLGLCVHLRVDGIDRLAPMAVEEPSVIAAASHAAKMLRGGEGIVTEQHGSRMIGQVQLVSLPNMATAKARILEAREQIFAIAQRAHPRIVALGGGARDLQIRELLPVGPEDPLPPMLVVHLLIDVGDAMGANIVNTICEAVAPKLADLSGGKARLRILSNLSDERLVRAVGRVALDALPHGDGISGPELADRIVEASVFAERDPYRASTHNKGIMNGIDAFLLSCGQDWRAIEAGAHAHAARGGRYTSLSRWRVEQGFLVGRLELPMAVGTQGGSIRSNPGACTALAIAGIETSRELAGVAAALGLAQNLAALRALSAEGIQRGHMRMHARTVALQAGAQSEEVRAVAERMAREGLVDLDSAGRFLDELRREEGSLGGAGL